MIIYERLKGLMTAQSSSGGVPACKIRKATSLSVVADALFGNAIFVPSGAGAGAIISDVIDGMSASQSDAAFSDEFTHLDAVADTMYDRIAKSMSELSALHDTVSSLNTQFTAFAENDYNKDPYIVRHRGVTPGEVTFNLIPWNDYLLIGAEKSIIDHVSSATTGHTGELTLMNIERGFSGMAAKALPSSKLVDVGMSNEVKEQMILDITGIAKKVLPEYIREFLNTLISKDRLMRHIRQMVSLGHVKNLGPKGIDTCTKYLAAIRRHVPVMAAIEKLDLAQTTKAQFAANIAAYRDIVVAMAHAVITFRRAICDQALILPNGLLNGDLLDNAKRNGITTSDIAHYMHVFHTDKPLPQYGVLLDTVIDKKTYVVETVAADKAVTSASLKLKCDRIKRNSFMTVAVSFTEGRLAGGAVVKNVNYKNLAYNISQQMTSKDLSSEECFYEFIIETLFKGSFMETLYNKFGVSLMKLATVKQKVTSDEIAETKAAVIGELVAEFLVDRFIDIVPDET